MLPLYLDYNSSTPVDPLVLNTMIDVYCNHYGNAASYTHQFGSGAKKIVDQARSSVAELLNVDSSEVIFTSGATESDNLAILGLAEWGRENGKMHIVSTSIEHKAVLGPLRHLASRGFEVELVSVGSSGRVEADEVLRRIRSDTLLVSVMHANNETGIIQPVAEIGHALIESKTYFHIDAAQTFGKLVKELKSVKYDLLSVSGHKIYGPQGVGALIIRSRNYRKPKLNPIMWGGGHEGGLRSGTLPVPLVAGLGKATDLSSREYKERESHNLKIRKSILDQLKHLEYKLIGDQKYVMSHTLSVAFPRIDNKSLMIALKDYWAISDGSACSSLGSAPEPSHVLAAMGLHRTMMDCTVRISWGPGVDDVCLPMSVINCLSQSQDS
jgi:cysteine desulfurase